MSRDPLTVYLRPGVIEKLKEEAESRGVGKSTLARNFILQGISKGKSNGGDL